jgi:hypothetical protein
LVLTIQLFILFVIPAARAAGLPSPHIAHCAGAVGCAVRALTCKRLLAEVLGLLDRDGFEASTIRHLADHLGASPMAPYNHVSSKQDLLQGIAQHVLTQTNFSSGHSN